MHEIEAEHGRERRQRWAARVLDLDLLALEGAVRPDPSIWRRWAGLPADRQQAETPDRLILPHPRLAERGFVLVPLADIAPGWRHPVTGATVRQMRDALPPEALEGIVRL